MLPMLARSGAPSGVGRSADSGPEGPDEPGEVAAASGGTEKGARPFERPMRSDPRRLSLANPAPLPVRRKHARALWRTRKGGLAKIALRIPRAPHPARA